MLYRCFAECCQKWVHTDGVTKYTNLSKHNSEGPNSYSSQASVHS